MVLKVDQRPQITKPRVSDLSVSGQLVGFCCSPFLAGAVNSAGQSAEFWRSAKLEFGGQIGGYPQCIAKAEYLYTFRRSIAKGFFVAIFHATLKTFGRSNGHSATAAAAYRIGAKIHDERTGVTHDYTKREGVVSVHTTTPKGEPAWASDPATLWNAAEASETRINARIARELEIALPAELSTAQRQALTIAVSQLLADRYRVAVMAAIHEPSAAGDQRNHHAHILFTTRRIGPDGFGEKVRELDDRKTGPLEVESLRAAVAALTNEHLERAGCAERVDHRRLNVQSREAEQRGDFAAAFDLSREPTRHEAKDVTALRRRGADPYGAAWNEAVRASNAQAWRSFVEQAANDGRLAETPARSNRDQAAADRAREAGAPALGVKAAASISPTPPRSVRRPHTVGPPLESGRNRIRLARGEGQQAIVVNSQAAAAEQTLKVEADVARAYRQDLEAALRQTALAADHPIRAYAELRHLTPADVGILAGHCHSDRRCTRILRDGIDAHRVWEQAKTRPVRRRTAHGDAMVQTARAQRDFENVDATPQPPVWKPRNRRQWAALRRRQRAHLADVQQAEKTAARATSETAMRRYAADELAARSTARAFEARRRQQYPLPSDRLTVPRPRPVAAPKKETAPMPAPERTFNAEMPRRPRP